MKIATVCEGVAIEITCLVCQKAQLQLLSTLLYQKTWGMLSQLDYHNIFLFSVYDMSAYV